MKALFNTYAPKQWRYIEDTHERYIISTDGTVIDLKPQIGPLDEELREPREIDFQEQTDSYNINRKTKGIYPLLRKTFPEYYTVSEEELNDLRKMAETQQSITYNVDFFNRLIFPNTLLTIYDTTCNKVQFFKNEKPSRVRIKDNGSFTLFKDRTYFAVGTKNIIHFDNLIPSNAKSWGERPNKRWYQENTGKNRYNTELF